MFRPTDQESDDLPGSITYPPVLLSTSDSVVEFNFRAGANAYLSVSDARALERRICFRPNYHLDWEHLNWNYDWRRIAIGGIGESTVMLFLGKFPGNEFGFVLMQVDGSYHRNFMLSELFPADSQHFKKPSKGNDYASLGFGNHFVVSAAGMLFLLHFDGNEKLSDETNPIMAVLSIENDSCASQRCTVMKPGSDDLPPKTFVVYQKHIVSVWQLNESTSELTKIQTIEAPEDALNDDDVRRNTFEADVVGERIYYDDIAVGQRYIVGFSKHKDCLYLLDRETGSNVAEQCINFGRYAFGGIRELYIPPSLRIIGDLLVCSYYVNDFGLLVWNLRTREVFKVSSMAASRPRAEVPSMVRVGGVGYTCFVVSTRYAEKQIIYGFPESEEGLRNLQEIVRRKTIVAGPPIHLFAD